MGAGDIAIIVFVVFALILTGLYFLNRWSARKMDEQQKILETNKQQALIFVIDKKKLKAADSSLPKIVTDKMPFVYKYLKIPLVKAKVGAQIVTLMCDKNVFDAIPVKKNVKIELSGMYITGMHGLKSKAELKAAAKAKILSAKSAQNTNKTSPLQRFISKARGFGAKTEKSAKK